MTESKKQKTVSTDTPQKTDHIAAVSEILAILNPLDEKTRRRVMAAVFAYHSNLD